MLAVKGLSLGSKLPRFVSRLMCSQIREALEKDYFFMKNFQGNYSTAACLLFSEVFCF